MTERLYYQDCYLQQFCARVVEVTGGSRRVYLDRTAFYPASGGQPCDTGLLAGIAVEDVVDEGERIAHLLEAPLAAAEVDGRIDWARRRDHMQQHTGQHLLSAVLVEMFEAPTLSFHLGAAVSTIEIGGAALGAADLDRAEQRANEIVWENRPVTISFEEDSPELGLRKPSEREGVLRIVTIQDLDRSACGGTHVRSTAEIGSILLRKTEKIRGNLRIELLCGLRALNRARADHRALAHIARCFSAPLDDAPALVAAHLEKARELDKARSKLAAELAEREGRELYAATAPDAGGVRRFIFRGPISDELRVKAQAFSAGSKGVFLAVSEDPPAILLAASKDSGIHAGDRVKAAVSAAGGRGGGTPTMAQGSVPSRDLLDAVVGRLS